MEQLLGELFGASMEGVMRKKKIQRIFVDHINEGRVTSAVRQRCKDWLLETMSSSFLVMFVATINGPTFWLTHMKRTGFPVRSLDKMRCVLEAMELLMAMARACKGIDGDDREERRRGAIQRVVENAAVDTAVLVAGFACLVRHKAQFKEVLVPSDTSRFLAVFGPVYETLGGVQALVLELNGMMDKE